MTWFIHTIIWLFHIAHAVCRLCGAVSTWLPAVSIWRTDPHGHSQMHRGSRLLRRESWETGYPVRGSRFSSSSEEHWSSILDTYFEGMHRATLVIGCKRAGLVGKVHSGRNTIWPDNCGPDLVSIKLKAVQVAIVLARAPSSECSV